MQRLRCNPELILITAMTNLRENIQFLPLADGQLIANKFLAHARGVGERLCKSECLIKTENGIAPRILSKKFTAHHL
jgi:hypothetical protein